MILKIIAKLSYKRKWFKASYHFLKFYYKNRPKGFDYDEALVDYIASLDEEIYLHYKIGNEMIHINFSKGAHHLEIAQDLIEWLLMGYDRYSPLQVVYSMRIQDDINKLNIDQLRRRIDCISIDSFSS
jgi:hypothetical protein